MLAPILACQDDLEIFSQTIEPSMSAASSADEAAFGKRDLRCAHDRMYRAHDETRPCGLAWFAGSPGGTRTPNLVVNSHPLYRLSYRGMSFLYFSSIFLLFYCIQSLVRGDTVIKQSTCSFALPSRSRDYRLYDTTLRGTSRMPDGGGIMDLNGCLCLEQGQWVTDLRKICLGMRLKVLYRSSERFLIVTDLRKICLGMRR